MQPVKQPERRSVLIVDDVPENLSFLSDALDEAGYMVLVATDGHSALERLRHIAPDVILLDAVMPGLDGFETCKRIKEKPETRDIPVIFMTGLTENEHVLRGFEVGGTDYVSKPIKPNEVIARVAVHSRNAREISHANTAIGAAGLAVVMLNPDLTPEWMTPAAAAWLGQGTKGEGQFSLPVPLSSWLEEKTVGQSSDKASDFCDFQSNGVALRARLPFEPGTRTPTRDSQPQGEQRIPARLLQLEKRGSSATKVSPLSTFGLTQRETEVLIWVARGKTNKDIADILGLSPRTVNKHLEHVYVKLGVETRTAAAAFVTADIDSPQGG